MRRAELIVLLEDGRVLERGTHEDLMRARGPYREMVEPQRDSSRKAAPPVLRS